MKKITVRPEDSPAKIASDVFDELTCYEQIIGRKIMRTKHVTVPDLYGQSWFTLAEFLYGSEYAAWELRDYANAHLGILHSGDVIELPLSLGDYKLQSISEENNE